MPLWKTTQHAFIAGQLDANVMGRQDMDRYFKGATLLKNFLVKRQGCISKRRGTDLTANLDGLLGTTYDGQPVVPGKMRLVPVVNGDDGRYLIMSGGLAFVADRDGLLTTDRRRVRTVPPYVGRDEYGRKTISGGNDRMYNSTTPIEVIHVVSEGVYENSRHAFLVDAFEAAKDGDTIRLHDDLMASARGGWVTEAGDTLVMTYDRSTHKYTATIGTYSRISDEVDENADVVHFTTPGIYVYRLQVIQKAVTSRSDRWTFSDGCNWTMTRYTTGNGGWQISDGTHTHTATGTIDATEVTIPTSQVTATRASSSATTWSFSSGSGWTIEYSFNELPTGGGTWCWKLTDGTDSYYKTGVSSSATSVTFDTAVCVCTRQRKRVTLDLYGYTMTFEGATSGILMGVCMDLTITSQRLGAKVVALQNGNWAGFKCESNATIKVEGGISWECLAETQGYFLQATGQSILTINSGTFERKVPGSGSLITFGWASGAPGGVINGGKFKGIAKTTNSTYISSANAIITCGIVTINGGEFEMNAPDGEHSYIIEDGNSSGLTIYGGRFKTTGCPFLRRATNTTDVNIWRGQFSRATNMAETLSGISDNTLEAVKESGSEMNEALPDVDGCYGVHVAGEGDYAWSGVDYNSTIYRIAVPYDDEDLFDLCIRQSGDTLFIAHRDYPPAKITFDSHGFAFFDEIIFDNTDYSPPVIASAVMEGQEPKETTWPDGFDSELKSYARGKGTVTDAGMNSNSSSGSDGSGQSATTWQATAEKKNRATGKKTVTIIVKSSTSSTAIETNRVYLNGLVVNETKDPIYTSGTAQNEASATSTLVTRTVRYVATYIKNGKESRPSRPIAVDYDMPWANNAVVKITLARGANDSEPDYYNVYKDNGNGYGLIATTGVEKAITSVNGYIDTYRLYMPAENPFRIQNVYDWETAKGWTAGSVIKRVLSGQQKQLTASTMGDVSLICTTRDAAKGIAIDCSGDNSVRFRTVSVSLDGRMYDADHDVCYLIPSYSRVRCTITYKHTNGTTQTAYVVQQPSKKYGTYGSTSFVDWPAKWQSKPRMTFTAPNGDTVIGLLLGEGDQSALFNETMRQITFDFSSVYGNIDHVTKIVFTFTDVYASNWINTNTQRQGVIRGIIFKDSSIGSAASTADVEDDYINPDMTVTPPDDSQDPHFGETDEYPGCVGIYDQRLVFASTRSGPSTIWMSRIADLYNFTAHDSIREDDALELTLAATEFPNINHLVMGRDLMLFGDGGEWLIAPVQGNALTYKTASAKLQSMIGSDRALQPLQLADETLFAERGGTCLRTINYNYASDSYQSNDLSVIAQSLFRANPIVSMAYKQHPDSIVECVLKDGRVATLVYMKEQDVAAWSVQELGGGWKAREIVSPKCIVHGTTEMMLLVEKDGSFQLWKVRDDDDALSAASQVTLDAIHVEATDAAPTGEVAVPLGDGTYAVGYPIESEFVSIRPEPEKGQTAQMEIKNSTETEIRVTDATTFSVKPFDVSVGWREVILPVVREGAAVALSAKDCKRLMTGVNSRDGRIHLRHSEPWPLTILSISTTYQVEYENGSGGDGQ